MKIIVPNNINLLSSNVSESLHSEWASGTTYAAGDRVYVTLESDGTTERTPHRIFESLVGSNLGNYPPDSPSQWVLVGSTNRWAMFDEFVSSQTENAGGIDVTVQAHGDRVALLDVDANTVDFVFSSELGTLVDVAGGNDGTLVNGPTWVDDGPTDDIPGALSFDGVDDRINTQATATKLGIDGDKPKTIEVWAFTQSFNNGGLWFIGESGVNGGEFSLRTETTDNEYRFIGFSQDIVFNANGLKSWTHFACAYDGTTVTVIVDGTEVASEEKTLSTVDTNSFTIGRRKSSSLDGSVTEVRIWNTTRTQSQIHDNKDKRLDPTKLKADPTTTTASDLTDNNNDGTLINGPVWTTGPSEEFLGALSFDGVDDYVSVDPGVDPTTTFSVETWVFPTSDETSNVRVVQYGDLSTKGTWALGYNGGNDTAFLRIDTGSVDLGPIGVGNIPRDQWTHLAGVHDGNRIKLYQDGMLIGDKSSANFTVPSGKSIGIAAQPTGQVPYTGRASDARIWNTARSQKQIQDNKDKRLTGTESGLVGYWPLDDGAGLVGYWPENYEEKTVDLNEPFVTDWFEYFFAPIERRRSLAVDKPTLGIDRVQITVNDADTAKVGTVVVGDTVNIATATFGIQVGFEDFSRKETNDFGETTLVERDSARLLNVPVFLSQETPAEVINRIAGTRGTAVLWDANENNSQFDALRTFGFFRDFDMDVSGPSDETYNIEIRGLT